MAKIGFCAIAGSGMSALAQVLCFRKNDVYGSDRSFDKNKECHIRQALEKCGIKIYPQDGSMLDSDFDVLYTSTAVEDSVPDVKKAKELGISVKKRSDLLAEIFEGFDYRIAVGGTSGKSTVTAMIGYVLDKLGLRPLAINGAFLKNYDNTVGLSNVILNDGNYCVVEADESDGSIEKYEPSIAVVNNISLDHKSLEELQELFKRFVLKAGIGAVVNKDCPNSVELLKLNHQTVSFGIKDKTADFFVDDIRAVVGGTTYIFDGKEYKLNLIGDFNVCNAMCAVACCSLLGVNAHKVCEILQGFLGTKRRLEVLGNTRGVCVIDDFAHNPDKVRASLSALKSYKGRLIVMFQPHGFSPMRMMGKEIMESFASLMDKEDILLVPEIFFAGGTVKRDISSLDLVDYAKSLGVNAVFFETREQLKEEILHLAQENDRIVLMGARDNTITDMGYELLEKLV